MLSETSRLLPENKLISNIEKPGHPADWLDRKRSQMKKWLGRNKNLIGQSIQEILPPFTTVPR